MAVDRTSQSQRRHDRMVFFIAVDLVRSGFTVRADHVNWPYGSPSTINDHTPDIVAQKAGKLFIVEIETCSSLNNLQTIRQLAAFSRAATTYVMIPTSCQGSDGENFYPLSSMQNILQQWHLSSTRIGTCNHLTGQIDYYPAQQKTPAK